MAISINWDTKVISVPKADLTLVQSTPTEIRELDLNWFRLQLKALESSEEGMPFLDTHRHNTEVSLGGLTYARVIEIINGYTVTFEDDQYAVNLIGANSNVADVVNVNQVSVRSANSAGLISNPAIEYASFDGGVTIDVVNGTNGTTYNIGTPQNPVSNLTDALLIAEYRGITKFMVIGDLTIPDGIDVSDYRIEGQSRVKTYITLEDGANTEGLEISDATVSGILDGNSFIEDCIVENLHYVNGYIRNCGLKGTITLAGDRDSVFPNCYTVDQDNPTVIDMGGTGNSLAMPNYSGIASIRNLSDPEQEIGIGLNAGYITLEDTVVSGTIIVSGAGLLIDNTAPGAIVNTEGLMSKNTISTAVWDESIGDHLIDGTTGFSVGLDQFDGFISLNTTGVSGIAFPIGTKNNPVNNLTDAVTIAAARGITSIHFESDYTFVNGTYITGYELVGQGAQKTTFTFEAGCILANCGVFDATVTGNETGIVDFTRCLIEDVGSVGLIPSSVEVIATNCLFKGTLTLPSNYSGKITAIDCYALPDSSGDPPVVDMGDCTADVQVRNWSGIINFKNITNEIDVRVFLASGGIILDSTVTAGDFLFSGVGNLTDNSTSVTSLNTEGLMSKDTVSQAVWDEPIASHLIAGSTGRSIGTQQFAGSVYIDTGTTNSGTIFPVGTEEHPVNNLAEALLIAVNEGISKFKLISDITVAPFQNVSGYRFESDTRRTITFSPGCFNFYTAAVSCGIEGTPNGYLALERCGINDLTEFYGTMENCSQGGKLTLSSDNTKNAVIVDMTTGNVTSPPEIDCNGDGAKLSLRGLTGAALITNKTGSTQNMFIDLYSGRVGFASSVTAGTVSLRGIGYVYLNEAGENVIFDTTGLMSKDTVAEAVWDEDIGQHLEAATTGRSVGVSQFDGFVTVSSGTSYSGIAFPIGTPEAPVNNLTDAVSIANTWGLNKIRFIDDYTFTSSDYISDLDLYGLSATQTTLTFEFGCVTARCRLYDARATGQIIGVSGFERVFISDLGNYSPIVITDNINVRNTILNGTMLVPTLFNGTVFCYDSYSTPDESGSSPIYDMNGSESNLDMKNHAGGLVIKNCTNANNIIRIVLNGGSITLDSTVTAGKFSISGIGILNDNSTSVTSLNTDGLMSKDTVSTAIWDEQISEHLISGTTGLSIGIQQFNEVVTIDVENGSSGTEFPIGTERVPVNNVFDAVTIADSRGIRAFRVRGNITVGGGPFAGFRIYGDNVEDTTVTASGLDCQGIIFEDCKITGEFINDSYITTWNCVMEDVTNIEVTAHRTSFGGFIKLINSQGKSVFYDCYDDIPGIGIPDIQVNTCESLGIWNFNGGIRLSNMITPASVVSLMIAQGRLWVDETCVAGDIIVKGLADLRGTTAGTTIDYDGLITKDTISEAVWDEPIGNHLTSATTGRSIGVQQYGEAVHVDTTAGTAGTTFPIGTERVPVNNFLDAVTIASGIGVDTFHLDDNTTISGGSYTGYTFEGDGDRRCTLTVSGTQFNNCTVRDLTLTGTFVGNSKLISEVATLVDVTDVQLVARRTSIGGFLQLIYVDDHSVFYDCYDNIPGIGIPNIKVNTCNSLGIWNWQGGIEISDMITPNTVVSLMIAQGRLFVNSSDVEGDIIVKGLANLVGTTGGTTIEQDGLITKETISEAVWDESIASHQTAQTTGHLMYHLFYENMVTINTASGIAGTTFPIGSEETPVDNLADALTIAEAHNFNEIHIVGDLTIDGEDITGYTFTADRSLGNSITITSMTNTDACYFNDLTVAGNLEGQVRFTTCVLGALNNFAGGAKNCLITNTIDIVGNGANYFTECDVYVTSDTTFKELSVNDKLVNLIRCEGRYRITNKTGLNSIVVNMAGAGAVEIDSSCTAGTIIMEGMSSLTDNSAVGCTVLTTGLINKERISEATWNATVHHIHYDATSTNSGTAYPMGTAEYPLNSLADVVTICENTGKMGIWFTGQMVITQPLVGYHITGETSVLNDVAVVAGVDVSNTVFDLCVVTGTAAGSSNIQSLNGIVSDFNGWDGVIINGGCSDTVQIKAGGTCIGKNIAFAGASDIIDANGAGFIGLDFNGTFTLQNLTGASMGAGFFQGVSSAGKITFDSSCTNGLARVYGTVDIEDNSAGGVYWIADRSINRSSIENVVWDAETADHSTVGTTGYALTTVSGLDVDVDLSGIENTLAGMETDIARVLGLVQENQYLDNAVYTTYNGQKLLTGGRIRLYSDAASVGTANNVIATYEITATWTNDEMTSYKMVKV